MFRVALLFGDLAAVVWRTRRRHVCLELAGTTPPMCVHTLLALDRCTGRRTS